MNSKSFGKGLPETRIRGSFFCNPLFFKECVISDQLTDCSFLNMVYLRIAQMREIHNLILDINNAHGDRYLLSDLFSLLNYFLIGLFQSENEGLTRGMTFRKVCEKGFVYHLAGKLSCHFTKILTPYSVFHNKEIILIQKGIFNFSIISALARLESNL